ncbi:MAG: TonB-dependent receptor plug domain-containing protein, partial [Muribaculaceae bacterium]|nr:TonB-dependent receptor plug domain-containing protein [Muribaculaceae bacterium]
MRNIRFLFGTLAINVCFLLPAAQAQSENMPDTALRAHRLAPLEVLGVKQTPDGVSSAEAVTRISGAEARRLGIDAVKGVSNVAPNVYMPDYGSRMTSSIYVRGLGARIDQPVMGLTVDNIPYLNKDNYDFDIADIESIEVLRGAQSVLNGRNTMGGQINVRTLSPLNASGWRASLTYANANSPALAASYYARLSERLGMSLTA